ncbi:fungal-specific transcription factor domain-containing protein [Aspergillus falconensis]
MPQEAQPQPRRGTGKPARQQPGLACEECRKRKARCDRAKPQCGSCMMTGRVCVVNHNRPRRGPKKGQIENLYSRLEILEEQVVEQMEHIYHPDLEVHSHSRLQQPHDVRRHSGPASSPDVRHELPFLLSPPSAALDAASTERTLLPSPLAPIRPLTTQGPSYAGTSSSPVHNAGFDLVLADLDQLYFDRVHPIAPFLHQQRYLSRGETEPPLLARACLRSAMRTVAAAMSAQFRRLADSLYFETSRVVRELDAIERTPPLEQIQAVLLLAHYELLRMEESRAMVTAGRCFRLIQLARLHDTDAYTSSGAGGDFVIEEEKRRTFWVAYCFDRFLSSRHEWPLTLQEEAIWTRLPVPESAFQTSQPPEQPMDFLHEAIASSGQKALSPFAEYIVLATLHGRAMNLRRSALLLSTSTEATMFWERHGALSDTIVKRSALWSYSLSTSAPLGTADPLTAFTHLLGRMVIIYIGEVGEVARERLGGMSKANLNEDANDAVQELTIDAQGMLMNSNAHGPSPSHDNPAVESGGNASGDMQRSTQAAAEFVTLARSMRPVTCFRTHPFLPNAISRAAVFLATYGNGAEVGNIQNSSEIGELCRILRELRVVNKLAREVLRELGRLAIPAVSAGGTGS